MLPVTLRAGIFLGHKPLFTMAVGTDYGAILRKREDVEFGLCPNCLVRKIDVRQATLTAVVCLLIYQQAGLKEPRKRNGDIQWKKLKGDVLVDIEYYFLVLK